MASKIKSLFLLHFLFLVIKTVAKYSKLEIGKINWYLTFVKTILVINFFVINGLCYFGHFDTWAWLFKTSISAYHRLNITD